MKQGRESFQTQCAIRPTELNKLTIKNITMKRKIGISMFWIGIAGLLFNYILQWITSPIFKNNTPEELAETIWATDGFLFVFNGYLTFACLGLSIIGVLLYTARKGSLFWLWGFIPFIAFGWLSILHPTQSLAAIFGIGGGIITLSYLGLLWIWLKAPANNIGISKKGKNIQLIGYSFLYVCALFLCIFIGTPRHPGLANIAIASGESIVISFSIGFLLLAIGHYLTTIGTNNTEDQKVEAKKLMELSRLWAQSASASDTDKTLGFWAEDAVVMMPGQPTLRGHAAIKQMVDSSMQMPGFEVKWESKEAFVSQSRDLGYALVHNYFKMPDPEGNIVTTFSKGVEIWKKQDDGSWKNIVDIFNEDPTLTSID